MWPSATILKFWTTTGGNLKNLLKINMEFGKYQTPRPSPATSILILIDPSQKNIMNLCLFRLIMNNQGVWISYKKGIDLNIHN